MKLLFSIFITFSNITWAQTNNVWNCSSTCVAVKKVGSKTRIRMIGVLQSVDTETRRASFLNLNQQCQGQAYEWSMKGILVQKVVLTGNPYVYEIETQEENKACSFGPLELEVGGGGPFG